MAKDVDASLVLAMAVVIDEIHDEENPAENTEALGDMLEPRLDLRIECLKFIFHLKFF